jgi:hypothetical protein
MASMEDDPHQRDTYCNIATKLSTSINKGKKEIMRLRKKSPHFTKDKDFQKSLGHLWHWQTMKIKIWS